MQFAMSYFFFHFPFFYLFSFFCLQDIVGMTPVKFGNQGPAAHQLDSDAAMPPGRGGASALNDAEHLHNQARRESGKAASPEQVGSDLPGKETMSAQADNGT